MYSSLHGYQLENIQKAEKLIISYFLETNSSVIASHIIMSVLKKEEEDLEKSLSFTI